MRVFWWLYFCLPRRCLRCRHIRFRWVYLFEHFGDRRGPVCIPCASRATVRTAGSKGQVLAFTSLEPRDVKS